MRMVRFTQSMMPYRRGDVAAFEDPVADRIIRKGVAELVPNDENEGLSAEERSAEPRRRRARTEDLA